MAGIEGRMSAAAGSARRALESLRALAPPAAQPHLAAATGALDRFMTVNAQIVALSRRNTNVRSLALSLDQKRRLVDPCEQTLRSLRDSLARHGYPLGR